MHMRPRSQLGLGQAYEPLESEYHRRPGRSLEMLFKQIVFGADLNHTADKIVHFNGEKSWDREPLRQTTRIKGRPANRSQPAPVANVLFFQMR